MKFFADEGVDGQIVSVLRENGFDVLYAAENIAGTEDQEVLRIANQEDRVLITRDKDFGELAYQNHMIHAGIILNRLYELSSQKKAETVLSVIKEFQEELIGKFTVIQPGKVRIKE
jgi:predicted nuclease of predicted toxin-antitoxin system